MQMQFLYIYIDIDYPHQYALQSAKQVKNKSMSGEDSSIINYSIIQPYTLQWRHNERDGVSNHQPQDCLLNRLFTAHQRKHQSSSSLAWPVNSPHKKPVTRKMLPFDDVIMITYLSTHWSLATHDCFCELGHQWFRSSFVARSAPSHYLDKYWPTVTINWTLQSTHLSSCTQSVDNQNVNCYNKTTVADENYH